jgi:hypothetical protein
MGLVVNVSPFADAPAWVRAIPFGDEQTGPENEVPKFKPESPYPFSLPEDAFEAARLAGASVDQLRQAKQLKLLGLYAKAKRQACCGVYGSRLNCSNTECGRRYFRTYRCRNRYCRNCGPLAYAELFRKYVRLEAVVKDLCVKNPNYIVAKIDLMGINRGTMPEPQEIQEFNRCIKRFYRLLVHALGIKPKDCGLLYCDEFGGANTNAHVHGIFVGPTIPRDWFGKGRRLSAMWKAACKGTSFEGSFIVSAKRTGFSQGLGHALKYAGKFLDKDPLRLAALEYAFHGVRRVHTLGALYNAVPKTDGSDDCGEPSCLGCGAALLHERVLHAVLILVKEGREDFDKARHEANRRKGFGWSDA